MKERPILFSTPMVLALLAGRKTQTRRVVKLRDKTQTYSGFDDETGWPWTMDEAGQPVNDPCPYGVPGDVLLVKESWCVHRLYDRLPPSKLPATAWRTLHWIADGPKPATHGRTRPGRFLPNSRVRTRLEITRVRVERVQSISDNDAYAEGIEMVRGPQPPRHGVPGLAPTFRHYTNPDFNQGQGVGAAHSFRTLWDSINGEESWKANPWVWVVEFKVLTPEVRA